MVKNGSGSEQQIEDLLILGARDFAREVVLDLKNGNIGAFTWGIGVGKKF